MKRFEFLSRNKANRELKMMASANRFVTVALALIFAISTTHLILHKPAFTSVAKRNAQNHEPENDKFMGQQRTSQREKATRKHGGVPSKANVTNFVIFDASQFSGSLAFLNDKQDGWRLLVINLKNMTQLTTCEICFLLKDDWIKSNVVDKWWSHKGTLAIDSNGLAKMATYAYVLSQGASWIYVTDRPIPIPYSALTKVAKHEVKTGLVYQGPKNVFDPCDHFMDPFTWKGRGYHKDQSRYNVKVVSSHSIYYVVNECFKKGMEKDDWRNSVDTRAPVPFIMPGTFASVDFNNVLVPNSNAWTLIASVFPRDEDSSLTSPMAVQINLMVQRVLWDTKSSIGFVLDKSNAGYSCPTCDLQTSLTDVAREALKKNLTKWRCEFFETIPHCLVKLSTQSFAFDKDLNNLILLWATLLDSHDWDLPERHVFSDDSLSDRLSGIPVYFTPAKSLQKTPLNDTRPPNPFHDLCREKKKPYLPKIPDQHIFQNIILIIVFNFAGLVSNIPLLDYAYGRHFKYIIYCSENMTEFEKRYQKYFNANPVTFVEIKHTRGYWAQSCMSATMKMGYDVAGFLQLSDDVLLNAWNLPKLPFNVPWFQSNMRVANIHNQIVPDVWINQFWWPWNQYFGRTATLDVYTHLQAMVSDPTHGERVGRFLENLYNITNCDHCFLYEASDIFYLPHHLISNFTFFSDIFFHKKVFLEIAIPTILVGITSDAEVYRLRGNYLWFQDREKYPYVYTEFDHFYHALKHSQFSIEKDLKFYCNVFLGRLDKDIQTKVRIQQFEKDES